MTLITDSSQLKEVCKALNKEEFITVDTEFLRDKFYYPKLCLIQIASEKNVYAVDPLAKNLDLSPLFEVFANTKVMKVFHSARQDLEIIMHIAGSIPEPLFDTQIAAMVCGFGSAVSYANLVYDIAGKKLDKTMQFTDWGKRPLSPRQVEYALSDVTYLRDVYKFLSHQISEKGRETWIKEEMYDLTNPENYVTNTDTIWERLPIKDNVKHDPGVMQSLAKWREIKAQNSNKPRGHIIKDHMLVEIACLAPKNREDFSHIRGASSLKESIIKEMLDIIEKSRTGTSHKIRNKKNNNIDDYVMDLFKILLKISSQKNKVAEKLIASSEDLVELISTANPNGKLLKGWRYEIFGKDAINLKEGKIAFSLNHKKIEIIKT